MKVYMKVQTVTFALTTFLSLFLITVLLTYLFIRRNSFDQKDNFKTYEYQILEFDSNNNETFLGTITTYSKPSRESVSVTREDGKRILVSDVGTGEFQCSGNCFCSEYDNERRTVSNIISRKPLMIFVGALSSVIAYDLAKEKFEDECLKELEDSCSNTAHVHSEVIDCSDVFSSESGGEKSESSSEKEMVEYRCSGNCYDRGYRNNFVVGWKALMNEKKKNGVNIIPDEEEVEEVQWKFFSPCILLYLQGVNVKFDVEDSVSEESLNIMAKKNFQDEHLNSFCKENSYFKLGEIEVTFRELGFGDYFDDYSEYLHSSLDRDQSKFHKEESGWWCSGEDYDSWHLVNRSIKCRRFFHSNFPMEN